MLLSLAQWLQQLSPEFGFLRVFCGANIPVDLLPGWMAEGSPWLPLTHGIEAARRFVEAQFTTKQFASSMNEVYSQLLGA